MSVVGLFAGIGGFELGFASAGLQASLLCDILPTARSVLTHRFGNVAYHDDVTTLRALPGETRIVCAGFPCQDLSQAGRTAGLAGDRSGLIGEVFRLLARCRVPTVVVENVPFMLQLHGGWAMRAIVSEFERLGYRWAYRVVDTLGFGLPQRRERVFLVASRELDPAGVLFADERPFVRPRSSIGRLAHGFYWTEGTGGLGWAVDAVPTLKNGSTIGIPSPPAILLPSGRLVKPGIEDAERMQGFARGWTQPAEAVAKPSARWGLVGSAVSVPVAAWLGRRLQDPGQYDGAGDEPFPLTGKLPHAARSRGSDRAGVRISADPIGQRSIGLTDFLGDATAAAPLSLKATSGFLARACKGRLRFEPGFLDAVRQHAIAMGADPRSLPTRGTGPRQSELALLEVA